MFRKILIGIASLLIILSIWGFTIQPSNARDWQTDQAILPHADFSGDIITIHNIRNFTYTSTSEYTPNYYDATYDLSKITSVDYIVEPFSKFGGLAHTFLTFGFEDGRYVAISVEIRKEKGEAYSPLKGFFKQYELMYVIADEKDVIKLRSNYRKDPVYLYPVNTTQEKTRALFVDMLTRANKLKDSPEFYNTLNNTCTTNIVAHVHKISPAKIPLSFKVLLPGYSDQLAYDIGLIDTSKPFAEVRAAHLINDKAERAANDPEFSKRIRE